MVSVCFYNGDFYQCSVTTSPGDSPASAPGKWRKVQVPAEWRYMLTELTYAKLLEFDGQGDKAAAARQNGLNAERTGLFDLVRREAAREQKRLGRPAVQTPYNVNLNGITGWPNAVIDK